MKHIEYTKTTQPEKQTRYKYSESTPETIRKSTSRAKQQVRRLVLGNLYNDVSEIPKFITLTFDPKQHPDCKDIDYTNYQFKKFRQRLQYSWGGHLPHKQIEYIAVPEQQQNGNWHYHTLFLNLPFITFKHFENVVWKYGGTNMKKIARNSSVTSYITKYFTKSYSDTKLRYKKRYFHSFSNEPEIYYEPQIVNELLTPLAVVEPIAVYQKDLVTPNGQFINSVTKLDYLLPQG